MANPAWVPPQQNPVKTALSTLARKIGFLNSLQGGAPSDKPRLDILYLGSESKVQIPRLALSYIEQAETSNLCGAMATAQIKHRQEVFRHLGEWKPLFQRKCSACDAQYKDDVPHTQGQPAQFDPMTGQQLSQGIEPQELCVKCGQVGTLVPPDPDFYDHAQKKFDRCNAAGQSIWKVLYQFHDDLLAHDDAWLVCIPRYWWKPDLDPKTEQPWPQGHENYGKGQLYREAGDIIRGNPNVMRIVSDGKGNFGGAFLGCPIHRTLIFNMGMTPQGKPQVGYFDTDAHQSPYTTNRRTPVCCPKCESEGRLVRLRDVWYVATEAGGQKPVAYYFEDEVFHTSFFRPSLLYGISPVVTLFREARSLIKMGEYIQEYFERRRIPRGIVAIRRAQNTPASPAIPLPQSATDNLKSDINRRMADDQHDIPFVAFGGADSVDFVPFADKLSEMEYIPVREEFKRTIGAYYGLTPLFMAQTEGSGGGLGNDSQQVAVTNRAIESAQNVYNREVFPWLLKLLGVKEWNFELTKPERQDILDEVKLELAATELAISKVSLGFEIKYWDSTNKRYVFSEKPNKAQQQGGGLGGPTIAGSQRGQYDTQHHDNGLGDESEGMSFKPKAPKDQDHEGSPKEQRRGQNA